MKYILCSIVVGCTTALAGLPVLAQPAPTPPAIQASPVQAQGQARSDRDFLRAATEGGLDEVTLGRLAVHKSGNLEIKAFGRRMVRDHTLLNNQIAPIAERLGVTPPQKLDAADEAEYDKLSLMPTADFNKAYMRLMVQAHRDDLSAFRHASQVTADPQLKRVVERGSMVIATHLRLATRLAAQLGINVNGPTHQST